MKDENIPWVEKYRPTTFNDIVIDEYNSIILKSILQQNYFPNILLYGPPGTGKTTTIINLIDTFQRKHNNHNKGLVIHLNASDERGIDIIRNQINQFVNTNALFSNGTKIVVLDEVDYMTKNAQQALKYIMQDLKHNVRFCLICNYITRIDVSLQNEFMRLRFNNLPEKMILDFLRKISVSENMNFSDESLFYIQQLYNSDIRSMINYMQSHQNVIGSHKIIQVKVWDSFTDIIKKDEFHNESLIFIETISREYNIEIIKLLKDYLNYIIRHKSKLISRDFLNFAEFIVHLQEPNIKHLTRYYVLRLNAIFKEFDF